MCCTATKICIDIYVYTQVSKDISINMNIHICSYIYI